MRNLIIEEAIDNVIKNTDQSPEFKAVFKQYIRNKFSGNTSDSDLKTVLSLIDVTEDIGVSLE